MKDPFGFALMLVMFGVAVVMLWHEPITARRASQPQAETSVSPQGTTVEERTQFLIGCHRGLVECKRQIDSACLTEPGRVALQNDNWYLVSCP